MPGFQGQPGPALDLESGKGWAQHGRWLSWPWRRSEFSETRGRGGGGERAPHRERGLRCRVGGCLGPGSASGAASEKEGDHGAGELSWRGRGSG